MKILATMMAMLFPISAFAGSCPSTELWIDYLPPGATGMTHYSGNQVVYYSLSGQSSPPSCDSNDHTRAEATQCKIDYWQKQTEYMEKSIREYQARLDCVRERLAAFKREANK